ncbi:MAG: diaminopimelate decarboxylase, partial [Actinomycetota bacterium]
MNEVLPDNARQNDAGHLEIAGCDAVELAERFGTPVIVLDRGTLESRARSFASVLEASRVYYAGKALCCVAVLEVVKELGLGLDVCSGGELTTALAAGFPTERIIFHGNNKSPQELDLARDTGVGRIVVDSFEEIERIADAKVETKLLIRVTPGVEAHTHEFVQTGQEDSKFGFSLTDGIAMEALRRASKVPGCTLTGVHAHIGSQIFEMSAFELAIQRLASFLALARDDFGFEATELNVGGGLGIAHTHDEMTPDPAESVERILVSVDREFGSSSLPAPDVFIEPGRATVGSSALTLYRVGTVKRIPGVRTYVSVDGGMSDNPRPVLYGSGYEAFLPRATDAARPKRVT